MPYGKSAGHCDPYSCLLYTAYTLPGVPSVYYGDEIGMEGYSDPFNRAPYDAGNADRELLAFYRKLGKFRRETPAFDGGELIPVFAQAGHCLLYTSRCV